MKNRIIAVLNSANYNIECVNYNNIYIADWSNSTGKVRGVEITADKPEIGGVKIDNNNIITTAFISFGDNTLVINTGEYSKQCECILFPDECKELHWVLCVETKYAESINAFKIFRNDETYPFTMVHQIIETVKFFRNNGVIPPDVRVQAILSFPKLINDFSSTFFEFLEAKDSNLSITNIMINHKIQMKATNRAEIVSNKRIKLL